MKEATCSKCGEIYNPEEFGDLQVTVNDFTKGTLLGAVKNN